MGLSAKMFARSAFNVTPHFAFVAVYTLIYQHANKEDYGV